MNLTSMLKLPLVLQAGLVNVCLLGLALPAIAQPAILSGFEPGSRVNIRSAPSVAAASPHYGLVGDRVETLRQVEGGDGYVWYYVRFAQTGATGWVRGDLIRPMAASTEHPTEGCAH